MASGRFLPPPPLAAAAALAGIAVLCAAAAALSAAAPLPQAAHAAAAPNGTYYLEGVGYANSGEGPPSPSQFGLAVSSGPADPAGRSDVAIGGGVVSLGGADYVADGLDASLLRGGDLIRISGTATGRSGATVEIGILGKLVQDGLAGSSYLFTGRIAEGGVQYRALYSSLASPVGGGAGPAGGAAPAPAAGAGPAGAQDGVTLRILPGSSDRGQGSYSDRTGAAMSSAPAGYFEPTRLSIEPGTPVTVVNGDSVPHRLVSGTASGSTSRGALVVCDKPAEDAPPGSGRAQGCTFTMDGRIDTGEIAPGASAVAVFSERALYRLADPGYAWMSIDVFAFGGARR